MGIGKRKGKDKIFYIYIGIFFLFIGFISLTLVYEYMPESVFSYRIGKLLREIKRTLRFEKIKIPQEEKRIREELILKKMEEISEKRDLSQFAPGYPKSPQMGTVSEEERLNLIKSSKEYQEIKNELNKYLNKNEMVLFEKEPPLPSSKDTIDLTELKDKAVEKVIEKLLTSKEKITQQTPIEENINLGIKGPLVSRKILYRPPPPKISIKTEAEIEMMVFVSPRGIVERVVPSMKADSELEKIAIQYLKQWRFVPLEKDQSQLEQWGTIPLKFKLN